MVTTTRYIYDGDQYLAEADETDTINRLYTNEPDAYTHLISQEEVSTGETLTYHYDALGSTRTVTDETEAVTDEFTYDAWGNRLSRSGTSDIPFQYVGEHGYYYDEGMLSYYVTTRSYDPNTTRWWSRDPLPVLIVFPSLYLYSQNAPSRFIDPSGALCDEPPNIVHCEDTVDCDGLEDDIELLCLLAENSGGFKPHQGQKPAHGIVICCNGKK